MANQLESEPLIKLEKSPDRDKWEAQHKRFYSNPENHYFLLCENCASKPGSPPLCDRCFHNLSVANKLGIDLRSRP